MKFLVLVSMLVSLNSFAASDDKYEINCGSAVTEGSTSNRTFWGYAKAVGEGRNTLEFEKALPLTIYGDGTLVTAGEQDRFTFNVIAYKVSLRTSPITSRDALEMIVTITDNELGTSSIVKDTVTNHDVVYASLISGNQRANVSCKWKNI